MKTMSMCWAICVFTVFIGVTANAQLTQKWFVTTNTGTVLGIGNVDADPQLEILVGSDGTTVDSLKLIDGFSGAVDWSYSFQNIYEAQLADVDADGKMEILFVTLSTGTFTTLRCYDADVTVGVKDDPKDNLPASIELNQNYPNPFNPTTTIQYAVSRKTQITLTIYNMLGEKVRTLVDAEQPPGQYTIIWDGKDASGGKLASGAYFYALKTETESDTKKMLLIK